MPRVSVAVVLLLLACTAPATAQIFKDPTFEASVLEPTLTPGTDQTVTVSLTNDAIDEDHVAKTARNVEVRVASGSAPLTVRSGPRFIDRLPDEERRTFDIALSVPADAPAGEYRLPVRLDYEFENDRETAEVFVTVRVEARPRFEVVSTSSDLSVGDRGTVTVTVENAGFEVASQSRLTLTSLDRTLSFGGDDAASRALGVVEPGEQRTVSFVASATDAARPQPYAASATLTYERPDGDVVSADVGTVSVRPTPEVRFGFRDVEGRLRLGERGVVSGTVVNRGPTPVWSVVAVLKTPSNSVRVLEPVSPVGRLAPGDSRVVSFPVNVGSDGTDGPQSFALELRYETHDGQTRTADDIQFRRTVRPEREPFRLEPVNASVGVDESARLTVQVTNVGDVTFRDVDARFSPQPPFTSEGPESYAGTLAPGESATLAYEVTVSEDAVANTHALAVNVTAERPDGRSVQHGPYYVPVTVTEQPGATSDVETLVAAAVLVLVVLVAGWWWLRA